MLVLLCSSELLSVLLHLSINCFLPPVCTHQIDCYPHLKSFHWLSEIYKLLGMTTPLFIILFLWQPSSSSFTMFHVYTEILATRNPTCSLLIHGSVSLHISFHSRILPYSILSTRDLHQIKKKKNSINLVHGLVSSLTLSAHITILYYSIYCFLIHYTVCLLL